MRERRKREMGLAHTIMEADKFHNFQSAIWRPRRVNGVVQPKG